MTRILVVDDDPEITKLLEKFLSNEGYQVTVASNGAAALSAASATEPELVLLDIVIGVEDGREVLRDLRLISDVPVIFLTGRGLETERIAGLKLGADDYIVKPFSLGEVSARIETVLRRSGVNTTQHLIEAPDISFGDLQINENTHEVRIAGNLLELTSKEFALLSFIATTPRQVYTRSQLLEHVWA
jgi:two-component system OmpR family response regulator